MSEYTEKYYLFWHNVGGPLMMVAGALSLMELGVKFDAQRIKFHGEARILARNVLEHAIKHNLYPDKTERMSTLFEKSDFDWIKDKERFDKDVLGGYCEIFSE